jgi:hypothetical protein
MPTFLLVSYFIVQSMHDIYVSMHNAIYRIKFAGIVQKEKVTQT